MRRVYGWVTWCSGAGDHDGMSPVVWYGRWRDIIYMVVGLSTVFWVVFVVSVPNWKNREESNIFHGKTWKLSRGRRWIELPRRSLPGLIVK